MATLCWACSRSVVLGLGDGGVLEGWVVGVNAEGAGFAEDGVVAHAAEDFVGLLFVVVDACAVPPAVGGEIEGHDVVLFTVGCGAGGARGAVGVHGPGEVADAGVVGVGDEHVGVGPVPEGVELALVVHLNGDHHAVGHAFGAGVVVGPVGHVAERAVFVFAGLEVDALGDGVAVEELLEGFFEASFGFGCWVALFGEEVAVFSGFVGAVAVAGHALDFDGWGVDVRGRWGEAGLGLKGQWSEESERGGEQGVTSSGRAESHEARLRLICACEGYQSVRVPSSLRAMGR